jgi:hypothetical protein
MEFPLCFMQLAIDTRFHIQQLTMSTLLHQATFFEHQQPCGATQSREPMGNRKDGPPLNQPLQCLLDISLGLGIDAAGGFV